MISCSLPFCSYSSSQPSLAHFLCFFSHFVTCDVYFTNGLFFGRNDSQISCHNFTPENISQAKFIIKKVNFIPKWLSNKIFLNISTISGLGKVNLTHLNFLWLVAGHVVRMASAYETIMKQCVFILYIQYIKSHAFMLCLIIVILVDSIMTTWFHSLQNTVYNCYILNITAVRKRKYTVPFKNMDSKDF